MALGKGLWWFNLNRHNDKFFLKNPNGARREESKIQKSF